MEMAIREWTPAEILIILAPNAYNGRQMVQYTLLDLIAKDVLQYEKEEKDGKTCCNLLEGPALHTYTPRPHEAALLDPFKKGQPHIQLKLFLKMLKQNVGGYSRYRRNFVQRSFMLQPYFKASFWNFFNAITLSDQGKQLQIQIKAQMQAARDALKHPTGQSGLPAESAALLALGGNVLLLAEMDGLMRRKVPLEELAADLADAFSELFSNEAMHTLGEAWSDIMDAVSDGGGGSDGGDSGGDSGCGSSGCGGGCGGS